MKRTAILKVLAVILYLVPASLWAQVYQVGDVIALEEEGETRRVLQNLTQPGDPSESYLVEVTYADGRPPERATISIVPGFAEPFPNPFDFRVAESTPPKIRVGVGTSSIPQDPLFSNFNQSIDVGLGGAGYLGFRLPLKFQLPPEYDAFADFYATYARMTADSHSNVGVPGSTPSNTELESYAAGLSLGLGRKVAAGTLSAAIGLGINHLDASGTFFASGTVPTMSFQVGYDYPVSERIDFGIQALYTRPLGSFDGGAGVAFSNFDYEHSLMLLVMASIALD